MDTSSEAKVTKPGDEDHPKAQVDRAMNPEALVGSYLLRVTVRGVGSPDASPTVSAIADAAATGLTEAFPDVTFVVRGERLDR